MPGCCTFCRTGVRCFICARSSRPTNCRTLSRSRGFPLTDTHGVRLPRRHRDAEGLAIRRGNNGRAGDTELLISFEYPPRIERYLPDGSYVGRIKIPDRFADPSSYRSSNKALETVTELPGLGVISGPELPLADTQTDSITLFSSSGRTWQYPLYATPNASLVAAEALADGSLLTVERGHGFMYVPITTTLRRTEPLQAAGPTLAVSMVAALNSSQGWHLDNFEGLAHHQGNRFFLISDDNMQAIQSTILVYFELEPDVFAGRSYTVPEYELSQTSKR